MKLLIKLVAALAVAMMLAPPLAAAQGRVIYCQLKESGRFRGVSPVLMFFVPPEGEIRILDVFSFQKKAGPFPGQVTSRSEDRIDIEWRGRIEKALSSDGGSPTIEIDYVAALFPKALSITVRGYPRGYDNTFNAQGKCRTK